LTDDMPNDVGWSCRLKDRRLRERRSFNIDALLRRLRWVIVAQGTDKVELASGAEAIQQRGEADPAGIHRRGQPSAHQP
jgi:hypothetical protein